ncbi:MAG: hypothetical protein IIC46_06065 [Planctomycetes bacterium]|nr:hypothetical protein [Planctomycetota bacterium]
MTASVGDMFAEAKAAWYISRDIGAGLSPGDIVAMLAASARRASRSLGLTLGKLEREAAADVILTDYRPATPLTSENFAAHLIFGVNARHTTDVLIEGRWALRGRHVELCDEAGALREAIKTSESLWRRMAEIPCP